MTPTNTHIFNNKKAPYSRPPMALPLNRYSIQVGGIGGEFVIGEVTEKVASYWNSQKDIDLGEFLVDGNGRMDVTTEGNRIDPGFSTERWNECDSISHVRGPVFDRAMKIDIDREEGASVFSASVAHRALRGSIIDVDTVGIDASSSYLMARSGMLMHQIYGLEIAGKFNVHRLTMRFKTWGRLRVLDGMIYDGKNLPLIHSCHRPMEDDKPMAAFVPGLS
jgi:hypothetical protein